MFTCGKQGTHNGERAVRGGGGGGREADQQESWKEYQTLNKEGVSLLKFF